MNIQQTLKKALPYFLIIVGFVAIAYAFTPDVLKGKIVDQSDISSWKGMSHEILEWNQDHPEDPALWTGSMFSGMPATQISVDYRGDATSFLYDLLFWGERPPAYLIISLIGAFLMFLAFGVKPALAVVGSLAVTFCSYNMQIMQVGHNTKMMAIAFMPWVIAALALAYRRNTVLGALLFALALSFQIKANHPQITYYLAFIVFGYVIAEFCGALRKQQQGTPGSQPLRRWIVTSAAILVAGLLGLATNANKLLPTYEYAEYTMRGGSELTGDEDVQTGDGLKLDYATAWSYGINETPNLLIPNFNGGSSSGKLSRESATYQYLRAHVSNAESLRNNMPLYWGPQPFTAGPMYLGAISLMIFVLGLGLIKGRYKWWIAGVSVLALLLAWGSHFIWFSELFFKYAPLYNKFRTVSMILVILQITVPLLGILGVNALLNTSNPLPEKKVLNSFYTAVGITGGLCLIFALFPSLAGDFVSSNDYSIFGNNATILEALREDRRHLLRVDAMRSLIFILLAATALFAGWKGWLKSSWAVVLVGVLLMADLWGVDRRYLNKDHFVTVRNFDSQFTARPVDWEIKADTDPHYRVLDLSVNTFNDAITSYHHKTIGGYSPAKLQRYQDLIEYHIAQEMNRLASDINATLATARTISDIQTGLGYYPVLAMLNAKYVIFNGQAPPLTYPEALGNAWLVGSAVSASTADAEMAALGTIDPRTEAVIYNTSVSDGTVSQYPASLQGSISLESYSPNRLVYNASIPTDGGSSLAVFSEIWYPAGWKAFVDGTEVEILRANYALRAIELDEGTHRIEFVYSPSSFKTGKAVSMASSLTILVLLAAYLVYRMLHGHRRLNGRPRVITL